MDREERAKQFMAFSPLRGYYDLIRQKQKVVVEQKDLSSDSAEELSFKFNQIKIGQMIEVVYFCKDEYVKCSGMVSKIDLTERTLTIVKTKISLDNIVEIFGKDIREIDE